MRDPIKTTTSALQPPSAEQRDEARLHGGSQERNDHYQSTWPCLNNIETAAPAATPALPGSLTVAAWNIERCKEVEASAELIRASGADVVLATELDWGMARSGQRHTTRDLAALLGFGYAFGVEFVELGTGDDYEVSLFADVPNRHGLHGNAILSRYPLENPSLIPIDSGGFWYVGAPKGDGQFRVGGRMAMAARIAGITFAAVHYESESDAAGRATQTDRLVTALDALYGNGPAVIGGDLNTRTLSDTGMDRAEILCRPETVEPSFARFAEAGFGWQTANAGLPTTRAAPGRPVSYPLKTLDWIFARGLAASEPRIVPAVSARGEYLSDHEMITTRILLP